MSRLNNLYLFLNDEKGRTLPRAKLFFYENNSFDFKNTYADKALTSVNPNPVIADGAGRFPNIFLEPNTYRVVLQDEDGVEISTKDDVDNLLSDGDNISNTTVTTASGANQTVAGALDDRVVRVGSVAGLADVTPVNGLKANVFEFWPDTGIGGGSFTWRANKNKTFHNGITVIDPNKLSELGAVGVFGSFFTAPGSGVGVWERSINSHPLTSWAGAVPDFDSSTGSGINNSIPVQAVINYLQNEGNIGGGVLCSLKGDYGFEDKLSITQGGLYIMGAGRRACRWFSKVLADHLIEMPLPGPDPFGATYFGFGLSRIRIQGWGTDGIGTGCGRGVSINDANNVYIDEVAVTNFPDDIGCFIRAAAFNCVLSRSEFSNCKSPLDINGGTGSPNKITMVMLDHVEATGAIGGNSCTINQAVMVVLNTCTLQDATHLAGSLSTTGQNLRLTNCETIIVNDGWNERSEGNGIFAQNCQNVVVNRGHYTSSGYTGGAVGTEDPAYPSIKFENVDNYEINKIFFYERNGNHIDLNSTCSKGEMTLIPVRDGTMPGVNDASANGAYTVSIDQAEGKVIVSNRIWEAEEFRASSTLGYALVGPDGSDYQVRIDASNKAYVRRNNDGVVRATGDYHYGGSTANRPSNPLLYQTYVDDDLETIIWWDGVNWRGRSGPDAIV